jgi:hypothetical protein
VLVMLFYRSSYIESLEIIKLIRWRISQYDF